MIINHKILFMTTMIISSMMSISAHTWLGMWIGLEINLLSIIPLMNNNTNYNILSSESSIKYFTIQAISSSLILMATIMIMLEHNLISTMMIMESAPLMILNSALMTKLGMAPFHFWFPEVMEGLSWLNCSILLTSQKIAPMVMLMYNMKFTLMMSMFIIMSMLISGFMGINQISLRKILVYSSINHMGWMMSAMMVSQTTWMIYFIVYTILTVIIVWFFWVMNISYLNQLYSSLNNRMPVKFLFMMNFLSLSGIPPFIGFLPKWLTIQELVFNNMILLPTIMIISTLMIIYMYIRITVSTLMLNSIESNWNFQFKYKFNNKKLFMLNILTLFSLILITEMSIL